MKKQIIEVPAGIRYISEWLNFSLPNFPHILDKQIPGCGFTEWAIMNNEDVVLCSPRKILLQNKSEQHLGEVFYVVNDYERIIDAGRDLSIRGKSVFKPDTFVPTEEQKKEFFNKLTIMIMEYIKSRRSMGKPAKILVTYDSFNLVRDILAYHSELSMFRIIIDEFQSIFTDSRFKASTELKFMSYVQGIQKVCFVSATPMLEEYLDRLDEFKHLPYFELDWCTKDPNRVMKPDLIVRHSKSVFTTAKEIIEKYKNGQYEKVYRIGQNGDPECVESKEAVFYVNSVNNICCIIKKSGLLPEDVNILCANTPENQKRITRKIGKKFTIGKVPLRGEQHKTFTFCTRTVYLGADFYSTCARTFVISDANIETLAVDISLDLPQILGRQRLIENPWKNSAEFYYKPIALDKQKAKEQFDDEIKKKLKKTQNLLDAYSYSPEYTKEDLAEKYEKDANNSSYKDDYVSVNRVFDPESNLWLFQPLQNNLVLIAEQRAYDIQQIDYKDRFSVFSALDTNIQSLSSRDEEVKNFMIIYESLPNLYDKLKYLCNYQSSNIDYILGQISEKHFREYYTVIGPDRCRSLGYNINLLNKELNVISFNPLLINVEVYKMFNIGDKLSKDNIKQNLSTLYSSLGYKKTAKATDLEQWFEIKEIQWRENGKKIAGFEIIKKKGD